MREELLKLDASKRIFDREIGKLVVFLHNKVFNIEQWIIKIKRTTFDWLHLIFDEIFANKSELEDFLKT